MAAIKGVGAPVVEAIIKEREENGEFTSIYDFCKRIDPKATNKRVLEGLIKSGAFSNLEKSRKQLLENLEYIVNTANKEAKAKELGQTNLFAGLEDNEDFAGTKFHLAGSDEEYSNKELQGFEKEFLGFYVSSHPLSSIMDKMQFLMSHKITEVKELPPDKVVTLCGLVTSARKIPYKKDPSKFLKTITMEDLTGKIEAICFHQKIGQFDSFMEPEMRIIITGKVSYREGSDEPNIIIDDVKPVDNANIFMISLKEEIPYEELVALKDGLAKHSGGDPVVIKVIEDGVETKIASSPTFWVNSSNDLAHSVKSVIDRNIDVEIKSIEEKL